MSSRWILFFVLIEECSASVMASDLPFNNVVAFLFRTTVERTLTYPRPKLMHIDRFSRLILYWLVNIRYEDALFSGGEFYHRNFSFIAVRVRSE